MNETPKRTELRKRIAPINEGGYDFHKSFRRLARKHLIGDVPLAELLVLAEAITMPAERSSASAALQRLEVWRGDNPKVIVPASSALFKSPGHLFSVKFEADFGLRNGSHITAIHMWNTKHPKLQLNSVYAALTLAAQAFESHDNPPDSLGVLSVRDPISLYRLSDVADQSWLAALVVDQLEDMIRNTPTKPPTSPDPHPPLL